MGNPLFLAHIILSINYCYDVLLNPLVPPFSYIFFFLRLFLNTPAIAHNKFPNRIDGWSKSTTTSQTWNVQSQDTKSHHAFTLSPETTTPSAEEPRRTSSSYIIGKQNRPSFLDNKTGPVGDERSEHARCVVLFWFVPCDGPFGT